MKKIRQNWRSQLSIMHYALCILMLSALCMTVTSCKDDDDDKNTSEQRNEDASPLDTEEAQTAWRWLCAMTDAQSLTADWAKKTYEPSIGVASENNALTRLVVVNNLDEARQKFASIADVTVDKLGTEQTVSTSGVGSLTWTPSAEGADNLAVVTVNTKLIPRLQKIIYCTEDQTGLNGVFSDNITGAAYYRFGDVIERDGYYWVCVRPCHEVGDKGKSHWINIFNAGETDKKIPDQYIYKDYNKKYNNKTILLPTQLKYNREHLHNLGNLICALLDPEAYHKTVGEDPKKSKGLGQFPYQYHNETFLRNVVNYWLNVEVGDTDLFGLLFNTSYEELQEAFKKNKNLCFYYKGYSWIFGSTGTLWCYKQNKYLPTEEGSESGDKVTMPFKQEGFDIRTYAFDKDADQEVGHPQVDDNGNYYWVVRYATGEELVKAAGEGKYTTTSGFPGYKEVYRYYAEKNVQAGTSWNLAQNADKEFENYDDAPKVGYILGIDNHLYQDYQTATDASGKAVAIVTYIAEDNEKIDISSKSHMLAIGLEYCKYTDSSNNSYTKFCWSDDKLREFQDAWNYKPVGTDAEQEDLWEKVNGIGSTFYVLSKDALTRRACTQAFGTMKYTFKNAKWGKGGLKHTPWFLPSTGQWVLALKGMGVWRKNYAGDMAFKGIAELFTDAGVTTVNGELWNQNRAGIILRQGVWTSTEGDKEHAYIFYVKPDEGNLKGYKFEAKPKDEEYYVFPFIAIGEESDFLFDEDLYLHD